MTQTEESKSVEDKMVSTVIASMTGDSPEQRAARERLQANMGEESSAEDAPAASVPMFDFEQDFQDHIVNLMVADETFMRRAGGLVEPGHFEQETQRALMGLTLNYHKRFGELPGSPTVWREVLRGAIADKRLPKEMINPVRDELKRALTGNRSNRDFFVERVVGFVKRQQYLSEVMGTMHLAERGELDEVQRRLEKVFTISDTIELEGSDFWANAEKRADYRKEVAAGTIVKDGITTGMKKLDHLLYNRGWGRRELTAIMGGAKRGKSMALGHFAIQASLRGHSVLYVSLEVSKKIIEDRMDANLSKVEMDDLEYQPGAVLDAVTRKRSIPQRGPIYVHEYPTGSFRPKDLRYLLDYYRARGTQFDLICIDYADIMAPDYHYDSDIANSKSIWIGLRGIAGEENAAVLTATQTNREGHKADVARAEHAAEDFNKIRIADLVISINRTDDEKAEGKARIHFAASRNQGGDFTILIKQHLAAMNFLDEIESIAA